MSSNGTSTQHRVQASSDLRWRVESVICDTCQDLCWSVEVWALDLAGSDAKACLLYREHLRGQAAALELVGRWTIGVARKVSEAERAAWLLEHQGSLW